MVAEAKCQSLERYKCEDKNKTCVCVCVFFFTSPIHKENSFCQEIFFLSSFVDGG